MQHVKVRPRGTKRVKINQLVKDLISSRLREKENIYLWNREKQPFKQEKITKLIH